MILRRSLGLPCVVDLDDPRLAKFRGRFFRGELRTHSPREVVAGALRLLPRQSVVDRAWAVHLFYDEDDDCVRCHEYRAVDAGYAQADHYWIGADRSFDEREAAGKPLFDPGQAPEDFLEFMEQAAVMCARSRGAVDYGNGPRAWVQMFPIPGHLASECFRQLRRLASMKPTQREGTLLLRQDRRDVNAAVAAVQPDDLRVYYGSNRPIICPKTKTQCAEVGATYPRAQP